MTANAVIKLYMFAYILTLLDDNSLHLCENVHHNGFAHQEGALRYQAPRHQASTGPVA